MDALDRMLTRLALADDARLTPVLASPALPVRKLVSRVLLLRTFLPSPALTRSGFQ
jgi:hypothetical protein